MYPNLPPNQNAPPVTERAPDQDAVTDALRYLHRAEQMGPASGFSPAEFAEKMARENRNHLMLIKERDHAHQIQMIETMGRIRYREQVELLMMKAQLDAYNQEMMALVSRMAQGKAFGSHMTKRAIDIGFDWFRHRLLG